MKKISWDDAIELVVISQERIFMSIAFWDSEFDLEYSESEVFECFRDKLTAHGPINSEGGFVGFCQLEQSVRTPEQINRFLYAYGNYTTKIIVANPSDNFIKNIPPLVMRELNEIGEFDEDIVEEAKKITGCDWFFLNDGNEYDEPIYFFDVAQK